MADGGGLDRQQRLLEDSRNRPLGRQQRSHRSWAVKQNLGGHWRRSASWRTAAAVYLLADSNSSERTAAVSLLADGGVQTTVGLSADSGGSRRTATVERWRLSTDGGRRRLASRRTAAVSIDKRLLEDSRTQPLGRRQRSHRSWAVLAHSESQGQWRSASLGGRPVPRRRSAFQKFQFINSEQLTPRLSKNRA